MSDRDQSISVVIPVHNGGQEILEQLEAIHQTEGDVEFEVVVVDNRSTDGTAERVRTWSEEKGRPIRIVAALKRPGEPYARNVGWRAARGEVVLFCDADDAVSPRWLPALAASVAQFGYSTGPLETSRLNAPWLADLRGRALFEKLPLLNGVMPFAHGCNMGFRRSVLEQLGGFDESLLIGCDLDIAARAWQSGTKLGWADDALVHYRMRSTPSEIYSQARGYARARRAIGEVAPASATRVPSHLPRRIFWVIRNIHRAGDRATRSKLAWVWGQVVGEISAELDRFGRGLDESPPVARSGQRDGRPRQIHSRLLRALPGVRRDSNVS